MRASWWRLGPSWGRLGGSWGSLGGSWGALGAVLAALGPLLAPLGALLAALGALLGLNKTPPGASSGEVRVQTAFFRLWKRLFAARKVKLSGGTAPKKTWLSWNGKRVRRESVEHCKRRKSRESSGENEHQRQTHRDESTGKVAEVSGKASEHGAGRTKEARASKTSCAPSLAARALRGRSAL